MTNIEELRLLKALLDKYGLPVSPILEYAIIEKEEEYASEQNQCTKVCEPAFDTTIVKTLDEYKQDYLTLSVGSSKDGKKLPHKAILLLSIMRMLEDGITQENKILLDKKIANAFQTTWRFYFEDEKVPSVWIPFWYMKSEPFWHFCSNGNDELLKGLLQFAGHPSVGQMRPVIQYVKLDDALFSLLQSRSNRKVLQSALEQEFNLSNNSGQVEEQPTQPAEEKLLLRKLVDMSVLYDGFTIPKSCVDAFLEHVGGDLGPWKKMNVKVLFDGQVYGCKLYKIGLNQQKYEKLSLVFQFRWSDTDDICKHIQYVFKQTKEYVDEARRNIRPGQRMIVKIPESIQQFIEVYATNEMFEFRFVAK